MDLDKRCPECNYPLRRTKIRYLGKDIWVCNRCKTEVKDSGVDEQELSTHTPNTTLDPK